LHVNKVEKQKTGTLLDARVVAMSGKGGRYLRSIPTKEHDEPSKTLTDLNV
jgi:hypothetical protein